MSAGYSGTPLGKKLGMKPGCRLRLLNAPSEFPEWIADITDYSMAAEGELADVVVLFVTQREALSNELERATLGLADRGGLWIAWPKKASKVPTDIIEDTLRDIILPTGLVDNKVCAISEVWSGLRFVRRLKPLAAQVLE